MLQQRPFILEDQEDVSTYKDILSDRILNRIASLLLKDWKDVFLELGMEYTDVEIIEHRHPNELGRQALAGLIQWRKRQLHDGKSEDTMIKNLLEILKEKRNDIVFKIKEMIVSDLMGNKYGENERNLKRPSMMYNQQTVNKRKRLAVMCESAIVTNTSNVTCVDEEWRNDGCSSVMQIENNNCSIPFTQSEQLFSNAVIDVRLVHKSNIVQYGKKTKKHRLALLLHTDKLEYLKANVFGKNITCIDKAMNDGYVYRLSGFKMKHNEYSGEEEMRLYNTTTIVCLPENAIPRAIPVRCKIEDIKMKKYVRKRVSLYPVIVTSVGPRRQPKVKILREVMVKDYTGKIKMNIWSNSDEDIINEIELGKAIELQNVELGMFNDESEAEYYITFIDISEIRPCGKIMQELLENEDDRELTPDTMSISDVSNLGNKKHIIINNAQIETFVKESSYDFIFENCDIDEKHGKLKKENDQWFCEGCEDLTEGGITMVQLRAEIVDSTCSSDQSLWVQLYNASSKVILGRLYNTFINSSRLKQNKILDRIAKKKDDKYRIEIIYNPRFHNQVVKKLDLVQSFSG